MPSRLFGNFGRKAGSNGASKPAPAAPVPATPVSTAQTAALDLARELLRGMEHFVLSTPDLDVPGFLGRLRTTAAQLISTTEAVELEHHRRWASESLSAFGQLQRRYLSEREDELWRLLELHQEHQKVEGMAAKQFHDALSRVHERMGSVVRLDDLRQVRERLEAEIHRATTLVEQKARSDEERALALMQQVQQLEAALMSARQDASMDPLTGVYHRGALVTQIESALASPAACSLALIDVDDFKQINDTLGHLVGDQILRLAVQMLGKVARPGDVLSRFGGDEFCLLAPATPANRLADRFESVAARRTVNFQFEERLVSVRLSLSIGVAGSVPGDTAEVLIQRADDAMYQAKRDGKARTALAPSAASCAA